MKSTDETWADPKFQQECAEMQEKVQKLRAELNSEVKELCRGTPLPPGYFRDEHGQTHKMSYVLTDSSPDPVRGANVDCMILDDNTFQNPSFWQRFKKAVKRKWADSAGDMHIGIIALFLIPGMIYPKESFFVAQLFCMVAILLMAVAFAAFCLWTIKGWTWDILKQVFKNE